jgi:hypothetical protein
VQAQARALRLAKDPRSPPARPLAAGPQRSPQEIATIDAAGPMSCDDILCSFRAARPGRSRRQLGAHAYAPATAAPTPVGWREKQITPGRV